MGWRALRAFGASLCQDSFFGRQLEMTEGLRKRTAQKGEGEVKTSKLVLLAGVAMLVTHGVAS